MPLRIAYLVTALVAALSACLTSRASAVESGGKIVFATNRAPNLYTGALYSIRPDGVGRRREALFTPGASESIVSPDRRRVVFVRYVDDAVRALFVARTSGGAAARRLSPTGISLHFEFLDNAAFSADGKRIAFIACEVPSPHECGPWAAYVVRLDGTGFRRIAANATEPSWSHDGTKVAYTNRARVFVVRLRDRRVWGLGRGNGPVWAPRGDLLAFSAVRGRAVCFVRPESSSRRCVVGDSTNKLMWSRDGRRLAFQESDGGELGVVNRDGRGLRFLAHGPLPAVPAAWSPDGRRIAYVYGTDEGRGDPRPGYELYEQSVIGRSIPRRVTREPDGTSFGQVFWDRGRIRYFAYRYRNDFELAVINPDGTGLEMLTRNELLSEIDPTWSPDGQTILFARGRLYTMSASGAGERPVTESGSSTDTNPAWSPSGDRIAFVRTPPCYESCQPPGTLMIRDAAGRERALAENVSPSRVSWSPDGRFIAFSTQLGLRILDSATGDIRRLETGLESSQAPAWSPDGGRIAFAALGQATPRHRLDLFTIRPDGSARTLIVEDVGAGGSWSPDGRRIVFPRPVPPDFVTQLVVVNLDGGQETVLTRNYSANVAPDWSR